MSDQAKKIGALPNEMDPRHVRHLAAHEVARLWRPGLWQGVARRRIHNVTVHDYARLCVMAEHLEKHADPVRRQTPTDGYVRIMFLTHRHRGRQSINIMGGR